MYGLTRSELPVMKVSDLIKILQDFKKNHGDTPVWIEEGKLGPVGGVRAAVTNGRYKELALITHTVNPMDVLNTDPKNKGVPYEANLPNNDPRVVPELLGCRL